MNSDIVIAHYKENIDWLNKLKYIDNIRYIYVYSKDESYVPNSIIHNNTKIIHQYIPNIGRESQTYLQYCIDKYDDLSDFTIFLQGNPCPHGICSKQILSWLKEIKENSKYKYTKNYRIQSMYLGMRNGRRNWWAGKQTEPSNYDINTWIKHYIDNNHTINLHKAKIYFGANFGVCKEGILSRTKSYYQNLVDKELQTHNPESCHHMERAWFYIFNMDKL